MALLGSASITHDVQVVGSMTAPQVLITTPPIEFDGGPVVVEFTAEYLNHIPASGTQLNGILFDLLVDDVRLERMGLAGTHSQDNNFWPINLRNKLDRAPRVIPAGTHTVGIAVSKWSANQDGYLKYSTGYADGWGMPICLTISTP